MLNPFLNRRRLSRTARLATTLAFAALLLPLAALRAPAQGQAGKLTGTIYDPDGAVIPNASVVLINPHFQITTRTNPAGKYLFASFPAGVYELQVRQPGFKLFSNAQVALNAGQETSLDVALSMGQITENLEVLGSGSGAVAATRTAQPMRIRVGGNVQATKLINMVKPAYPESEQAAGIQGYVVMEARIGTDGRLASLKVLNSVDPALDQAAIAAVQQWQYEPTLLNGRPVEVTTNITVNFKLP